MVDHKSESGLLVLLLKNGKKKKKAIMKTIKNKWWIFYESNKEVNKKVSLKRPIKWLFFILQKKTT
jgi:hypothetical protein